MGELYLAVSGEKSMEKVCVIKTVLPHMADDEFLSRFRDEAKVVVKLSHGNLVPVFDAGQNEGRFYVAMDFIDGKDLRAIWNRCAEKRVAFPIDVAIHIVKEICRGLDYAHRYAGLRLVHRDVSPPNVLVSYTGEVKLADFGLATSALKVTETAPGIVYGKLAYMSPEQASGKEVDGRSDVYSAGILLWEMLCGRRLFVATDKPGDLLRLVREPKLLPPSQVSPRVPSDIDALLAAALQPDREARFQTAEHMRAALAEYLAKVAPATDASRLAAFLRELFGEEIEAEQARRSALLQAEDASQLEHAPTPVLDPTMPLGSASFASATSEPSLIGTLLGGRYQIQRLIGEGGMGRVYEARHVEIDKRVAVKVLHPVYTHMPEVVSRFRREARAASKIGHPAIVDITDSGTTPHGSVYFVMEFLEGIDLADLLAQQGRLHVDRAVNIAGQVCRALAAAHDAGIVHRDLKPENIFLITRDGNPDFVKIVDFGIAQTAEFEEARSGRLTRPGMAMGTPEYMAPEQAAGKNADARADIYALGAILYEMIGGKPPHQGDNIMEVLSRKATERPTPLSESRPEVLPELEAIVQKTLEHDPAERPQTMAQLEYLLNRCMRGRGSAVASLLGLPDAMGGGASAGSAPIAAEPSAPLALSPSRLWMASLVGAASLVIVVTAIVVARDRAQRPVAAASPGASSRIERAELSELPASGAAAPPVVEPPTSIVAPPQEAAPAPGAAPSHKRSDGRRLIAEASVHLRSGRFAAARDTFRAAQTSGAEKGAVLAGLAAVAFQEQRFGEAVELAEKAVASRGGGGARIVLANSFFKLGRYPQAAAEYEQILRRDSGNREAVRNLEAARQRMRVK